MAELGNARIQGLDVLRGLAILLVMVHHAWPEEVGAGGIVGVVSFFTLSGYLITGVLQRDILKNGRVRYKHFYRNRALRLLPALLLLLIVFAIYTAIANPFEDRGDIARSLAVAITYTANIPFDHGSPVLSHLWTLATEEQFYLVWPLLLAIGLRWKRIRLITAIAAASLLAVCIASIVATAPDIHRIYTLPTSWALAMVIGSAAKIGEAHLRRAADRYPMRLIGAISAGGLVALSFLPEAKESPLTYLVLGPLVAVLTVALIFYVSSWASIPTSALRPLLALGTVSYAAYLWNWPVMMWAGRYFNDTALPFASIVLTIIAAAVSWWLVERPANEWKKRLDAKIQARSLIPARN